MKILFSYKSYSRPFIAPVSIKGKSWASRKGYIVRLENKGKIAFAEVAPIPDFGTESFEDAKNFLSYLEKLVNLNQDIFVPSNLPCCSFAISSAIKQLEDNQNTHKDFLISALLMSQNIREQFLKKQEMGFRYFKIKIGIKSFDDEWTEFKALLEGSNVNVKFRLDANENLTVEVFEKWLQCCKEYKEKIDFFEQPLCVGKEDIMKELSKKYDIKVALEESVIYNNKQGVLDDSNWEGPIVVKPSLLGNYWAQYNYYKPRLSNLIFSSAFETSIGLFNCLNLAKDLELELAPLGFDTQGFFYDNYGIRSNTAKLDFKQIESSARSLGNELF